MKYRLFFTYLFVLAVVFNCNAQQPPRGNLFIIGGGDRPPSLMQKMVAVAGLSANDYIVVLPMSSAEPDTSVYYFKEDMLPATSNKITSFNFKRDDINKKAWLDSLQNAKLIFITGGDQNRFMKIVLHTPVHQAILKAYAKGATIAGTSAGAAVMSKEMITGNEIGADSSAGPFKTIKRQMVEIKEGLGLISTAIIDQHFIVRSRYNRLLSVLADYPSRTCIGVDEATALIIHGNKIAVTGQSQVVRLKINAAPRQTGFINLKRVQLDLFVQGESFLIN